MELLGGDHGMGHDMTRRPRHSRRWFAATAMAGLLLAGGCSSDGEAEASGPESTDPTTTTTTAPPVEDIDFTATSTTSFGGDEPCGDGGQALDATGEGESPELGAYTLVASHCTLLPSGQIVNGKSTYTLADGDEIHGTYTGQCDLADLSAAMCTLDITFDGGTGRFSEVTGSVTAESVADVIAGTGRETLTGTLSGVRA